MKQPIIIYSFGRSGSNILLDCLDLSSATHCRNEVHLYPSSPLNQKILQDDNNNIEDRLIEHWDDFVYYTNSRWGYLDRHHPQTLLKDYYKNFWDKLGVTRFLIRKNRTRQLFSFVYKEFEREEYKLPSWLLVSDFEEIAIPVFKTLIYLEDCLPWIMKKRPDTKIVHLIRYPLGYIKSLYKRLYKNQNADSLHRANRLNLIARLEKAKSIGLDFPLKKTNVEHLNKLEVLVWNWAIANQIIYQQGKINDRQTFIITYEQLLISPVETIKSVYDYCGLPWSIEIENAVCFTFKSSISLATNYISVFSEEEQQITLNIINRTSLKNLWNNEMWSSLEQIKSENKNDNISYSPY